MKHPIDRDPAPKTTYRGDLPVTVDRDSIALHALARRLRWVRTTAILAMIAASVVVGLLGYEWIQRFQFARFGGASVKANVVIGFAPPVIVALASLGVVCRWLVRRMVPSFVRALARRHGVDERELREAAASWE